VSRSFDWSSANSRYLGAALSWLRLLLQRAALEDVPLAPTIGGVSTTASDAEIEVARLEMATAATMDPPPALVELAERLGLSMFEQNVLLLCAAPELDTGVPALCAAAHGTGAPTFALALTLFDDPAWDILSPERPLRYWRLVEISQAAAQPLTSSSLRVDERVVNALKGLDHLDDRLSPFVQLSPQPARPMAPSQEHIVDAAVGVSRRAEDGPRLLRLDLVGEDKSARAGVAGRIAQELERRLYRLPIELLPTLPADVDLLARLWQREARLARIALFVETEDVDEHTAAFASLQSFLGRAEGLVLLGGRDVRPDLPGPSLLLDVGRPTGAEQRAAWDAALSGHPPVDTSVLVAQFDLDTEAIELITDHALATGGARGLDDRLWDGARRHARPRLDALAQRVRPVAGWDDLVLPEAEMDLLHQIADQVAQRGRVYEDWGFAARMNRGLGISALFAGESGTGKSMAAEVLAMDLRLDLYRIDLSSVVSKYIGETEKNLRRLFDAADGGGAILLFDEADALFGKRSEVKDAHDRYANIEVNYLLQRMEAHRGLAILATNMKSSLDRAFTRRLRFIVNFPFPTLADRARLWAQAFPAASPVDGLDIGRLAHLSLTGAGIHNAALNAAFLAATADRKIGMGEVLEAARNELRKLDRPINEADFRLAPAVAT